MKPRWRSVTTEARTCLPPPARRASLRSPGRRTGGTAVGLGEGGEELEPGAVPDGADHGVDRRRIVEVPPGGQFGEQQVVADEADEDVDVVGAESETTAHDPDELDSDVGVVPGEALPDVVEERADEEQVGAAHTGS
jgi:hypothetical protein